MSNIALEIKNLSVEFHLRGKIVKAVSNLSWKLENQIRQYLSCCNLLLLPLF